MKKKINKDSFSYQLIKISYITSGCLGMLRSLDSAVAPIFKSSAVQNRHWAVVLGLTGTYVVAQGCIFFTLSSIMNDGFDELADEWNDYVDYEERWSKAPTQNLRETERQENHGCLFLDRYRC